MPKTPKIVTRSATTSSNSSDNLNKGSKLTFAEMDSNFIELKNGAIGVVADDSSTLDVKAGDTLYIQGGDNVTTSTDSAGVLTINSTGGDSLGDLTAVGSTISSPSNADISLQPGGTGAVDMGAIRIRDNHIENTRSNDDIIVDPNGTGNIILNPAANTFGQVEIKGGGKDGSNPIVTQLKIHDSYGGSLQLGDNWALNSVGTTIASSSGTLTLQGGNQSGNIHARTPRLSVFSGVDGELELGQGSGSGGEYGISKITTPHNTTDNKGADLHLRPGEDATTAGDIVALGLRITGGHTGTTITADATNAAITLQGNGTGGVNLDGVMVQDNTISTETSNSNIELRPNGTGSVIIDDATLVGTPKVGDGTGTGTLTSNGAHNLVLNTNSGTNSGSIEIVDGATGQISVHTNGHGNISIGSNTGTGDGTATTTVEGTQFKRFANSTTGAWLNIPMSADGSTSQDVRFQMNSGKPELYFNSAGSAASDIAKIRVGTGGLTIQTDGSNSSDGNIRIQSAGTITLDAVGNINLGGDTIVVSGNKMFTDASNEDFELEANGTGNISMLSPANMNSNKIINVTDPAANQDAATKAYVDTQVSGVAAGQGFKVIGDDSAGVDIPEAGTLYIQGGTNVTTATDSAGVVTINSSASGTITALNNQAENRLVSIGSTTTQLDGEANLTFTGSVLGLTGTQTITNTTTDDSLTVTTTEDSASAGPVITLKRNSSSPADADYLGQLKFKGENDADQAVNYAKVTGKISDASDGTEDGLIEFALMKAGSNNIGARLTSTQLKLINGTGFEVAGLTFPTADGSANQVLGTNGSGVLSFRDPTAINIDGGVADSTYTSVPTIDGGTA